ncbi:hypothetical protein JM18_006831 [Phytophthora kernoviae]|uniref:Uncharacterized protein n=1 Tax=Phytophthora kernoviae TaxID=325452 RepID=A0A921V4W9_9STRA|nr:hypothetical protein JM18_006831 [Phytophthora kernoviae]
MMENLTLTHLDLSDNTLGNNGNAAADLEEVYDCASMEPPQEFFEDKDGDGKIDVCGDICMTIGLKNLSDIEQNHVEQKFLKEFKQLQVPAETKLIGLRSISTLYYFTCSQTQRLMEHFGTFERDSATGCLLRGEVFIVMFNRIIDEWNLSETLSLLDLTTKTQVLDRLGMLNCFHPLQQSEVYRQLQLNAFDQRQLILFLVKLAASGEAELTNVQLNGDTVEPEMWKTWTADDKLPTQGALGCSMRALQPVQSEAQLPPTSMRKKLMQTLLFKLPDKAQEQALS